jgi:hypothetical protein
MFCIFEVGAIEIVGKLLEIFKWVGPMCHWPTTAHGSVSAHRAHTHAAAPRWLSYRTPLRAQCCRPQHALPCAPPSPTLIPCLGIEAKRIPISPPHHYLMKPLGSAPCFAPLHRSSAKGRCQQTPCLKNHRSYASDATSSPSQATSQGVSLEGHAKPPSSAMTASSSATMSGRSTAPSWPPQASPRH